MQGHSASLPDPQNRFRVDRTSLPGSIEVHDVQRLCSGRDKTAGDGDRIPREFGDLGVGTAKQPDTVAIQQIDCGIN
jgi:hypothetical protein